MPKTIKRRLRKIAKGGRRRQNKRQTARYKRGGFWKQLLGDNTDDKSIDQLNAEIETLTTENTSLLGEPFSSTKQSTINTNKIRENELKLTKLYQALTYKLKL